MDGAGDAKQERIQFLVSRAHGPGRETNTSINQNNTVTGTPNQPREILTFKGEIALPKLEGS